MLARKFSICILIMLISMASNACSAAPDQKGEFPVGDQSSSHRLGSEDEGRDGEIMIYYDAKKHPVTLEQLLQELKTKTKYNCSISEWKYHQTGFPIIRVETKMPLMIINDTHQSILKEAQEFVHDPALSKEETIFLRSCGARVQVCGAGNPTETKTSFGTLISEPKYAPKAKDTLEVVKVLMDAVDGIAECNTDGTWIRR